MLLSTSKTTAWPFGAQQRARDLGYRRFFDIKDLVGLRVEDLEVFRATHTLPIPGLQGDGCRLYASIIPMGSTTRQSTLSVWSKLVQGPGLWPKKYSSLARDFPLIGMWPALRATIF